MNILFFGDIVGRTGRVAVKEVLPTLKKEYKIDLTIANGENLAGGFSMTFETYREMTEAGIDYFTSGNHIWKKADFLPYLDDKNINILRPANYPENVPGRGVTEIKIKNQKVVIINLAGMVFMPEYLNNPFLEIDKILKSYLPRPVSNRAEADGKAGKLQADSCIIVDFHAEATSEKVCLGHYLDGRVSAVVGTHTHIATADARVLPGGTAYITDVGMAGALESSLGDEFGPCINHFLTALPFKLEVADGPAVVNAVVIKTDNKTGLAKNIQQISKIVK